MRAAIMMTLVLTAAAPALAQTGAPGARPTASDAVRSQWNTVKRYMQQSAEQMPEATYSFKATPEVRSFGEILAHVAGVNYAYCSSGKGETSEFGEESFINTAKTKAAITKALADSIAYCDAAYKALTDATMADPVKNPFGENTVPRLLPLVSNIAHNNEHYGNLVTYFRLNKMVPPSSK
jgi:uncharacterized damage-inducible protein DinB